MASRDLQHARFAWRRTPLPVENFRHQRADAPTYAAECDLDHVASYVAALLEAYEAFNPH